MLNFSKTARNFFMILSLGKVENIYFHMNLVSQLAALVCQPGVHRNKERRKQLIGRHFGKSFQDMTILDIIFLQNGSKFFHDTFSRQSRKYFLSHELSQLAVLVCQPGVHRNKERRKQLIGRNLVISLYDILLDDIFLKNGSKFFHNIFPG